jgi:hypothetical protein
MNLEIYWPLEVLIEVGFAYVVHRGECACVLWASALYCVILTKNGVGVYDNL